MYIITLGKYSDQMQMGFVHWKKKGTVTTSKTENINVHN